jgi:curved DNA-binding protein CbpA
VGWDSDPVRLLASRREGPALADLGGVDIDPSVDYYEALQISPSAEPETVHRVYRLLAQRFHPDNMETGSDRRFNDITQAYRVLSDPERRARYDQVHAQQQRERWRVVDQGANVENDFAAEQRLRAAVLEILYTKRRIEPNAPGVLPLDLEKMTGRPREHLEFTTWYLVQKKLALRGDNTALVITAEGVESLEAAYPITPPVPRLRAVNE